MVIYVNGMVVLVYICKFVIKVKCYFWWKNIILKYICFDNNLLVINENFEFVFLILVFFDYLGFFWNLKKK